VVAIREDYLSVSNSITITLLMPFHLGNACPAKTVAIDSTPVCRLDLRWKFSISGLTAHSRPCPIGRLVVQCRLFSSASCNAPTAGKVSWAGFARRYVNKAEVGFGIGFHGSISTWLDIFLLRN
jgi:hypothetical protein